jgi:hypothetical protein
MLLFGAWILYDVLRPKPSDAEKFLVEAQTARDSCQSGPAEIRGKLVIVSDPNPSPDFLTGLGWCGKSLFGDDCKQYVPQTVGDEWALGGREVYKRMFALWARSRTETHTIVYLKSWPDSSQTYVPEVTQQSPFPTPRTEVSLMKTRVRIVNRDQHACVGETVVGLDWAEIPNRVADGVKQIYAVSKIRDYLLSLPSE